MRHLKDFREGKVADMANYNSIDLVQVFGIYRKKIESVLAYFLLPTEIHGLLEVITSKLPHKFLQIKAYWVFSSGFFSQFK